MLMCSIHGIHWNDFGSVVDLMKPINNSPSASERLDKANENKNKHFVRWEYAEWLTHTHTHNTNREAQAVAGAGQSQVCNAQSLLFIQHKREWRSVCAHYAQRIRRNGFWCCSVAASSSLAIAITTRLCCCPFLLTILCRDCIFYG